MTTSNNVATRSTRYALLTNASAFSLAVLQALLEQRIPPGLIVLPEYPPADSADSGLPGQPADMADNPLRQLAANIPVAYAPKARQRSIPDILESRSIRVMLVACWPYLIDPTLDDCLSGAALNLHPSMLPEFRGPDPIAEQLQSGHRLFGVTLHKLSNQFDRGDLVAQAEVRMEQKNPDRHRLEVACARAGVSLFAGLLQQEPVDWHCWPQVD